MVEGINPNFWVKNISNTEKNKSTLSAENKQNVATNPIDSHTMAGLESLGVYNMSLVQNKDNFNHKPAEPIIAPKTLMDDIEGDKVFDPNGKLEYIVQNDGKYETRYYPLDEKEEFVGQLEIKNVYDGKMLKEQTCNPNMDWTSITEYSQEHPNIYYITRYCDGKIESIEKREKMSDGSAKHYSKNFFSKNPELSIHLYDKNYKNSIDVSFDSQNIVKNISTTKNVDGNTYYKDINLNKGAVIGIHESKDTVVPNFMEREVLNDTDVMPTEKFDRKKIEKFAKNDPKDIYSFYGNGHLKEINDKNIKIEFNEDSSQNIKEYLDDGVIKSTSYNKDGSINVHYQKGDLEKYMSISSENKPTSYSIYENNKCIRSASFTEEGYLNWVES